LTHTTNPMLVIGIAVAVASFGLVHLALRWQSMRARLNVSDETTFTRVQRAMHWGIGFCCAALLLTGLPVYLAQFLVNPPVPTPLRFFYWGVQVVVWRTAHIYLGLLVVLLVAVHSLWDVYRVKATAKIMRVSRADLGEARRRARDFLRPKARDSQRATKYDAFQKAFHWTLIALGAFLLVSGLLEWEAIRIGGVPLFVLLDRVNNAFMDGFMRTGHLIAAMLFAGLLALHVYFAVLPQNRPFMRAISLGSPRARSGAPRAQLREGQPTSAGSPQPPSRLRSSNAD
jgi:cytochrome b subunit of formate dehydrogenase